MKKKSPFESFELPEFYSFFPPGMIVFISVIMLTIFASSINSYLLFGIDGSIYFSVGPEKMYFIGLLFTVFTVIPNIMATRGYNRVAIKIIRYYLLPLSFVPIPFLITSTQRVDLILGTLSLAMPILAYCLTHTITYQMLPHYFEKSLNWKKKKM